MFYFELYIFLTSLPRREHSAVEWQERPTNKQEKEGLKNRLPKQILPLPMGIHDTALERNLICVSVSQSFSPDRYQQKLTRGVSENF